MWVCVHDHVFGGKSRRLADLIGCSQDEAVGLLVRLWVWGLTNCDRTGRVQYADTGTIADMLVQGLSKSLVPSEIVECLIECEYLDVYDDAIYIHDWADWQKYWYSYQDRLHNDAERPERTRPQRGKRPRRSRRSRRSRPKAILQTPRQSRSTLRTSRSGGRHIPERSGRLTPSRNTKPGGKKGTAKPSF